MSKVIGIDLGTTFSAIASLDDLGNPYDILLKDKNGKKSIIFGIYGIPESILLNKEFT